jgi:tetratricopeptide (TPR) repeat protein
MFQDILETKLVPIANTPAGFIDFRAARRRKMRVLSIFLLMTLLGAAAALPGQSRQETWTQCKSSDPEQSIRGCSAIILSAKETGVNLAKAFNNRGSGYAMKGDYDHAIQDYTQALRITPNSADASYGRGWAYEHKSDYDHAIQNFDQAVRQNLHFAIAWRERGLTFTYKGRLRQRDPGL